MARPSTSYLWLAALSGCVWGAIAVVLSGSTFVDEIWGGVFGAPLIGIAIGLVAYRTGPWSPRWRVPLSLLTLYLAATLWGLCIGIVDALLLGAPNDIPSAVVIQTVLAVLWGLTFSGYVVVLWPLAYLNHWWLGHVAARHTAAL